MIFLSANGTHPKLRTFPASMEKKMESLKQNGGNKETAKLNS
jgi:hypothetical protein